MSGNETKEDIRVGYQMAISLMTYEGDLVWSRFNILLAVNTAVFALGGFLFKGDTGITIINAPIFIIMSVIGIILCVLWFTMTSRGFATLTLWTYSSRLLEEKMSDDVITLQKGNAFRNNKIVEFKFEDSSEKIYHQRPWYSRLIKTESAAYLTIVIMGLVYLVILVAAMITFLGLKSYPSHAKHSSQNFRYEFRNK